MPSTTPVSTSLRLYGAGKPAPGTESSPSSWETLGRPATGLYWIVVVPVASWTLPSSSSPVLPSVVRSYHRSALSQYSVCRFCGVGAPVIVKATVPCSTWPGATPAS
ncbi:MAG TPA: hypothetical protein VGM33_09890 [Baekduia sp.]